MNTTIRHYILILLYLLCLNVNAQTPTPKNENITKITQALDNYFALDRESIHLHLNKNIFLTNESIWFKGYILNRKFGTPHSTTTNVFVTLLDENGKKIDEKLVFASNGTFFNSFKLNKEMNSGSYFVQVYTNWMNNFSEDESCIEKVTVVNEFSPSLPNLNTISYHAPNLTLSPEGGTLVYGINNTVGVKLLDCRNRPFPITEGDLLNSKGEFITKVFLNKFGHGKFDLIPSNENYKIVFNNNGNIIQKELPLPSQEGILLDINNYNISNRTVVKVRINPNSVGTYAKKPIILVVHQDDKACFFEIDFSNGKNEQEIIFSHENLYDGVNTIRLIDHEFNEIAQRLVFKYPDTFLKSEFEVDNDSSAISLSGNVNLPHANISVSVIPEKSIAADQMSGIYTSLLIKPYMHLLQNTTSYYFNDVNRSKRYEMDLLMLSHGSSKYDWNNILKNPPKANYEFDYGLSIAGKVNQDLGDFKKYKIRLRSHRYQIFDIKDLTGANEFIFRNMVLPDSARIDFTLLKMPKLESTKLNYSVNVLNGKRTFNKTFNLMNNCTSENEAADHLLAFDIPKVSDGIVYLEDVEVKNPNRLKRQNFFGNTHLRGYKVRENDPSDVLSFIEQNGFNVSREPGYVMITERNKGSINAAPATPVVYIDNIRIMSYEQLWGMRMDELDEIYINSTILVPSVTNNRGVIKLYRKPLTYKAPTTDSKTYFVKNGFTKNESFKNISYTSFSDKGFENFGVINWIPNLIPNETNNTFKFEIPYTNRRKVTLLIEGFTEEGKMISEIKTVTLP